jgi:hypothetical protein
MKFEFCMNLSSGETYVPFLFASPLSHNLSSPLSHNLSSPHYPFSLSWAPLNHQPVSPVDNTHCPIEFSIGSFHFGKVRLLSFRQRENPKQYWILSFWQSNFAIFCLDYFQIFLDFFHFSLWRPGLTKLLAWRLGIGFFHYSRPLCNLIRL